MADDTGHRRRRSDDHRRRVYRLTGVVMLGAGASLPLVTFLGYTAIWVTDIVRRLEGLPHLEFPGPPWDTWEAIIAATVLTLVGGFLFQAQDDAGGGKLVNAIVELVTRRGGKLTLETPPPNEAEERQLNDGGGS